MIKIRINFKKIIIKSIIGNNKNDTEIKKNNKNKKKNKKNNKWKK